MNSTSNRVYLLLMLFFVLLGCEDEQPVLTKTQLDLKSFYIIRDHNSVDEKVFAASDLNGSAKLTTLDKIGAEVYPANVTLVTSMKCKDLRQVMQNGVESNTANDIYSRQATTPFTEPVSIFSIMPEEALFRVHNMSSDSLDCTLSFYAVDEHENRYVLSNPISGVVYDTKAKAYLDLKANGNIIAFSPTNLPVLQRSNMNQYSLQSEARIGFDSQKIVCDTFTLKEDYSSLSEYLDFKRINFSNVVYNSEDFTKVLAYQSAPRQTCRIFVYNNQRLVGYSHYFQFQQEMTPPNVRFDISSRSAFLGSPNGPYSMSFHEWVTLGTLLIENPNNSAMFLTVNDSSTNAKIQLIGNTHLPTEPVKNAVVYDVYSHIDDSASAGMQKKILENKTLYRVPAKATLAINYFVHNLARCRLSDEGMIETFSNTGRRLPMSGGGTFGLYYQVFTPEIQLVASVDAINPEAAMNRYQVVGTYQRAVAAQAFIAATQDTVPMHPNLSQLNDFQGNAILDVCKAGSSVLDLR